MNEQLVTCTALTKRYGNKLALDRAIWSWAGAALWACWGLTAAGKPL